MLPRLSHFAWTGLLALPLSAQGAVYVVDDTGGPGVDFTDLPDAVATVAEGDLLLVRDGTYSPFSIQNKSLTIVADSASPPVVDGGIVVEQLVLGKTVLLRGLATGTPSEEGLRMANNNGTVIVEECQLVGQDGFNLPNYSGHSTGYPGISVSNSAWVFVIRSTVTAGDGATAYDIEHDNIGRGGVGIQVSGGHFAIHDSTVTGGQGGSDGTELGLSGFDGGAGTRLDSGRILSSGSTFTGGRGGHGGSAWQWKGCGNGGDGGPGFIQTDGQFNSIETATVGGAFGFGVAAYGCVNGQTGADLLTVGGGQVQFTGQAAGLSVPAPIRSGVSSQIDIAGQPGDVALIAYSTEPTYVPINRWSGTLLVGGLIEVVTVGTIPAGGTLTYDVLIPDVPGVDSVLVHTQAAFFKAGGGVQLGPYSSGVLLGLGH